MKKTFIILALLVTSFAAQAQRDIRGDAYNTLVVLGEAANKAREARYKQEDLIRSYQNDLSLCRFAGVCFFMNVSTANNLESVKSGMTKYMETLVRTMESVSRLEVTDTTTEGEMAVRTTIVNSAKTLIAELENLKIDLHTQSQEVVFEGGKVLSNFESRARGLRQELELILRYTAK